VYHRPVVRGAWLACTLAFFGCGRGGFDAVSGAWSKRLSLAPLVAAPLADFPVAIMLSADPDLEAYAQADGTDLAVTAADGVTPLPTEIERWDPTTGSLVAWVLVPELAAAAETDLVLHYGGPPAGDRGAQTVWTGYAGTWHFGEDPASGFFADSSGTGNAGHVGGPSAPTRADGVAGFALAFDGVDSVVSLGNPPNGSLGFATSSFSYGVWVYTTAHTGEYDMGWYKGGSSLANPGYDLELGANGWGTCLSDASRVICAPFGMEPEFLGRWVHLVAVVDRSAGRLRAFADGAERTSADISGLGSVTNAEDAVIGSDDTRSHPFLGTIDEVRVVPTALSADWIAAEHANLTSPTFLQVGPAEPAP
jgi:hypothetical protein